MKILNLYFPNDVSWEIELYSDDSAMTLMLREFVLRANMARRRNGNFFPQFYIVSKIIFDVNDIVLGVHVGKNPLGFLLKYVQTFTPDSALFFLRK